MVKPLDKKSIIDLFDKYASTYDETIGKLSLYNTSYDEFLTALPDKKVNLLEIGCGPGNISNYITQNKPQVDLFAIDISDKMIAIAKQNNPTVKFEVMDCRKLDTINYKFDGILIGFCIPYLNNTECEKLIIDSSELLNSEGLLYLSFIDSDYYKEKREYSSNQLDSILMYYYDTETLVQLLEKNNFELHKLFTIDYSTSIKNELHRVIIAKKHKL